MTSDKNNTDESDKENSNENEEGITRRRFLIGCGALATAGVASGVAAREMRAVHPEWPPSREGDPVPSRPGPDEPTHYKTPFLDSFEDRKEWYLEWAGDPPRDDLTSQICSMELGYSLDQEVLQKKLDKVDAREAGIDFALMDLVRIYYKYADTDLISSSQLEAIKDSFLNFKYWLDTPYSKDTKMALWTENHQISVHSSEYLVGQLFPDETFTNNEKSGQWHKEHARSKLLDWLDWHARTGFAEWDSVPYYRFHMAGLLNLIDFAEDEEISQRAAIVLDQMFLCMAADSFYGQYGTSRGRTTSESKVKSFEGDSLATIQALLWGLGRFKSKGERATIFLTTSDKYELPPVLEEIGQDMPEEMTNKERHSINLTDETADRFGLGFDDIEDVWIYWGMQAFTHPKVAELTVRAADKWGMWHYPDFAPLEDVGQILSRLGLLEEGVEWLGPPSNGFVLSQVNKVTYRTPDYMLSCAQDYRKGQQGWQQRVWQATLGPYAVVFVTNPGSSEAGGHPGYWVSQGRFPRAAQHRNVLISIYDIDRVPTLMEGMMGDQNLFAFTHAYFPRWAFDEIVEIPAEGGGGWIFGRKGEGYVALYSHLPYEWQTEGPDADQEVIALGRQNVWICQLGREAVYGSFEEFTEAIRNAPVEISGLRVSYDAPGEGLYEFGWEDTLSVDGEKIDLRDYPRFDNPYCHAEFGESPDYNISLGEHELEHDFDKSRRVIK